METYGEDVRLVYRDFPLPNHPNAQPAAEAALCAHEQGEFWRYHDKVFDNQRTLSADHLKQFALDLGLDATRFNECFDSGRFRKDVQEGYREGGKLGVSATPTFFINGRFLSGAQPFEAFRSIIDEELEK